MRRPGKDAVDPPPVEERPVDWPVKCQMCGTVRRSEDGTLCPVCGEPVIIWRCAP